VPVSARWRWRIRQLRRNPVDLLVLAIASLIVAVAIDRGITSGKLTWSVLIFGLCAIPAILLHEISHGVVAKWCGDDTAKRAGRLSLNPRSHIDPIGSIIVPAALVLLGGPVLGWARPVPVTLNKLRHPRNQAVLVSLAGPITNFLLAAVAGVAVHFLAAGDQGLGLRLYYSIADRSVAMLGGSPVLYWVGLVVGFFGLANIMIGIFNLVPIPPLDGSALLERFIPVSALPAYYRFRQWFFIVLVIVFFFARGLLTTLYSHMAGIWLNPTLPHIPGFSLPW
jgi:Zn-dependent protease